MYFGNFEHQPNTVKRAQGALLWPGFQSLHCLGITFPPCQHVSVSLCRFVSPCPCVRVKVPAPPLHCLRVTFLACQRPQSSLCDPPDSLWPWHNLLPGRWPGQVPGNPPWQTMQHCATLFPHNTILLCQRKGVQSPPP